MSNLPELTEEQYEAAVRRAGENTVLTSGAGCGKTLVLARRFNELIMQYGRGKSSPFEHLVALTFTDKAADEMVRRVRLLLLEMLKRTKPGDVQTRRQFADWITELPAAHISTIHSFCASLLRRYAIEAGIDPDFTVCADELLTSQLLSEAAEQAILQAVEAGDPETLELLTHADMKWVARFVKRLLEKRLFWNAKDYDSAEKILSGWEKLRLKMRDEKIASLREDDDLQGDLDYLRKCPCRDESDILAALRNETLPIIEQILNQPDGIEAGPIGSLRIPPGNAGKASAWGSKEQAKQYRNTLSKVIKQFRELDIYFQPIPANPIDKEAARFLTALINLACQARETYNQQKRTMGMVDFDDLIDFTAKLLLDNPDVRSSLQRRVCQLLVDECQDVDPYQLEMLSNLISDQTGRPTNIVALIGDVKQSIYHFRGVDVEQFSRLCRRFGLKEVPLGTTFRMHRAGVSFINHLFSQLMENYEPITSARQEVPAKPSVEILLTEVPPGAGADDIAESQAELIAEKIAQIVEDGEKIVFDSKSRKWRPARFGDFAILFARMTKSLDYEHALEQRGIPYYVVGGVGFFQQQETYDMLNALRAIDNPFDDIALFGLLRSEVFGLDDNVLLHIASSCRPPYFPHLTSKALAERLVPLEYEQLCFAHDLLERLHHIKDATGPAGIIEEILSQTGYAGVLLVQPAGKRRLGNVRQLITAARSWHQAGNGTLADFIRQYSDLALDNIRYEQAAVIGADEDVVRIMTIHKAKGLEFPIVIVPELNVGVGKRRDNILFSRDWGITFSPPKQFEQDVQRPISNQLAGLVEREHLQAEEIRKMYVAFTRHKDYLILVGADCHNKDGGFKERGSCLDKLDAVFNIADAVESGRNEIKYDKRYSIRIEKRTATHSRRPRLEKSKGLEILSSNPTAGQLFHALSQEGQKAGKAFTSELISALVSQPAGESITVTSLCDFAICPMLYRWRYELCPPVMPPANWRGQERSDAPLTRLDPTVAGTFFHRCMELVDFDAIRSKNCESIKTYSRNLASKVISEMELTIPEKPAGQNLADMLIKLKDSTLITQIINAQRCEREIAFVYKMNNRITLTGQMDLLYQDTDGRWHIVDYKSDNVVAQQVAGHARKYKLQMMLYLVAARRHFGENVSDATIYFLKPGMAYKFSATVENLASTTQRLEDLTNHLFSCRATGRFERIYHSNPEHCRYCPYASLCLQKVKNAQSSR